MLLAISGGLINTITGLSDTWILKGSEEVRVNFSFIKAFGSIGWASGSLLLSILIGTSGYTGLSLGIFGLVVASMLVVFFLKDIEKIVTKHTEKVQLKDFKSVILNQNYRWLIIILFLLYSAIIANNITVVDKMITLGATDLQIGYKWSIQSLFEIPAYLFGARLFSKWSNFTLLKITACVLSLQFILFALSGSSWVIIGLSALQFFTTPLLMISSKQLIFSMTDERMQSTGQLFALSIFTGLSSLVVPVLAGYVTKAFNVDITLFIVGIVPIIALWMTAKLQLMTIKNPNSLKSGFFRWFLF
nr:MFS transporter [Listeria fleischmannii]